PDEPEALSGAIWASAAPTSTKQAAPIRALRTNAFTAELPTTTHAPGPRAVARDAARAILSARLRQPQQSAAIDHGELHAYGHAHLPRRYPGADHALPRREAGRAGLPRPGRAPDQGRRARARPGGHHRR